MSKLRLTAIAQALLVTFLWSTSWVLIKFGLDDIPALTFAGLRYFLAFLILLVVWLRRGEAAVLRQLDWRTWWALLALGVVYYTLTQGSQFLGIQYLPAITFSLMLNFSAPLIALFGIWFLGERLNRMQWLGMLVFLLGAVIYFYPVVVLPGIGLLIGIANVVFTSIAAVQGRAINRGGQLTPLTVTVISMGVGGILLLALGLAVEPPPVLTLSGWGIVLWLAFVNTAFAFVLWNHTLRTLSAAESGIINNTMLVQIAVLAWLFLGENPGPKEWLGMVVVIVGVVLVNMKSPRKRETA